MKKSLLLASLLLTSSNVYASQTSDSGKMFIGIGISNGAGTETYTLTGGGSSTTSEYDFDSKSVPLTWGYITYDNNRVKLSYQKITMDWKLGASSDKFSGIDFDFDWTLESIKVGNLLPYLGVGIGSYTYENTAQYFADNEDLRGIAINLNAGLLYSVSDNLEFEAAYKNKSIQWQDAYVYSGWTRYDSEMDEKMSSLYLGLNYKF